MLNHILHSKCPHRCLSKLRWVAEIYVTANDNLSVLGHPLIRSYRLYPVLVGHLAVCKYTAMRMCMRMPWFLAMAHRRHGQRCNCTLNDFASFPVCIMSTIWLSGGDDDDQTRRPERKRRRAAADIELERFVVCLGGRCIHDTKQCRATTHDAEWPVNSSMRRMRSASNRTIRKRLMPGVTQLWLNWIEIAKRYAATNSKCTILVIVWTNCMRSTWLRYDTRVNILMFCFKCSYIQCIHRPMSVVFNAMTTSQL